MWGRIDNWQQALVFIIVLLVAVCIALALHYLLVRILSSLGQRSGSKTPDLIIKHLRWPTQWVMVLLAVGLSGELPAFPSVVADLATHLFAIVLLGLIAWLLIEAVHVLSDIILLRLPEGETEDLRARKVYTQINVLRRILNEMDLWDRKVGQIQVTNASERTLELRVLVSARDAGTSWDLRCYVREKLVEFLQKNYPQALPKFRADLGRPEHPPSADARVQDRNQRAKRRNARP